MSRKYRDAAASLQLSVQRHLQEFSELSSSENDEPYDASVLEEILQRYCKGGGDRRMLNRTKNILEEALSGNPITCLICISSVKRTDAIWTCGHCYCYFHLTCVQKWSIDSVTLRSDENEGPVSIVKPQKTEWCCPKCRFTYNKTDIPRKYYCFCGKNDDPTFHPWLIPHSCGEICEKRLSTGDSCKHKCLLLCHPGPCPPCPQTVNGTCYCEKEFKKVRCSAAKWSCNQTCQKTLLCKTHKCEDVCHEGECPPCHFSSSQSCNCGAEITHRPCNDPHWQCQRPCQKSYPCGYHKCEKVCHSGNCGPCPSSGNQSCPCGANKRYVECPDTIETCLGTCNKKHDCEHTCPEKCHKGPCPPCQVLVQKKCQCGTHLRSLPCSKEFRCETKCRGTRPCRKHSCGRKCCNGNCPPCEKICDKQLQCGRHRCTNICHLGPCYPCPQEIKVPCNCKKTIKTVPCGRYKMIKPPRCTLPCHLKYKCGHVDENKHSCHFGECPPCKAVCGKKYNKCEHYCKTTCHKYVLVVFRQVKKPATPWEAQRPKTKITALDCPPCETPLQLICFGEHETDTQVCHSAKRRSCGRECGKPLTCGNHKCTLECHLLREDPAYRDVPSVCKPCDKPCLVSRPEKCTHKCPKGACHPGPCPPCEILERVACHCNVTELYIRCRQLSVASEDILSCKQQCPKSLVCGHRCKNTCHSGPCTNQICTKKTKAYCVCRNIKKELPCNLIRDGEAKIECDESCEKKKLAAKLEKEMEEQRQKKLEEEKNRRELAEYEWKLSGKKKNYKEKKIIPNKDNRNMLQKNWIPIISVIVVMLALCIYCVLYN
ncbi:NF-X1-type zinc finger protein NFXL1 [Bombyx mandarina]|uniref:NF-X1-type zinc finger protein NFXL1 n=1 Tax=Bombyx mandarina TaxID=7092 RepID=A0A6J2KG38_BOMMA|nr:NF-X1-type zinc finger protein NFXL1 [Bombyx mandarina]